MSNPILDPIFGFFSAIWSGLTNLWYAFVSAVSDWFSAVWNYKYAGIPVGPVMFIAISLLAVGMIWGFFKLRQFLRTS